MNIRSIQREYDDGLAKANEAFESVKRRYGFGKKKQSELLRAIAGPLRVGRPHIEVARHIEKYGIGMQKTIGAEMAQSIQSGKGGVRPLRKWIDPLSYSALDASKDDPRALVRALELVADNLGRQSESGMVMLKVNAYPMLMLLISIIVMVVFIQPVVDQFKMVIDGAPDEKLDSFISLAEFYKEKSWVVIVGIIAVCLYVRYYLRNATGLTRDKLDKLAIFSGYRLNVGARIVSTFALLKEFDMSRKEIIDIFSNRGGPYERYHGAMMKNNITEGARDDVDALNTGLFDEKHISLLKLYTGGDEKDLVVAMRAASKAIDEQLSLRSIVAARMLNIGIYAALMYNLVVIVGVIFGFDFSQHR